MTFTFGIHYLAAASGLRTLDLRQIQLRRDRRPPDLGPAPRIARRIQLRKRNNAAGSPRGDGVPHHHRRHHPRARLRVRRHIDSFLRNPLAATQALYVAIR
jgi:hypothetical protein